MAMTPNDTDTTVAVEYFLDDDDVDAVEDVGLNVNVGLAVGLKVGAAVSDAVNIRIIGCGSLRSEVRATRNRCELCEV